MHFVLTRPFTGAAARAARPRTAAYREPVSCWRASTAPAASARTF